MKRLSYVLTAAVAFIVTSAAPAAAWFPVDHGW